MTTPSAPSTSLCSDVPSEIQHHALAIGQRRINGPFSTAIAAASDGLLGLDCLLSPRGDRHQPAPVWRFTLHRPAWVLLAVYDLDNAGIPAGWKPIPQALVWRTNWGHFMADRLVARHWPAGEVEIPSHAARYPWGHGMPHLVLVADALPPAPTSGDEATRLVDEVWRAERTELTAEGFRLAILTSPWLRLDHLGRDGQPSLVRKESPQDIGGIRTWVMEPTQTPTSGSPAMMPARILSRRERRIELVTEPDAASGLSLCWDLAERGPGRFVLRHGVTNRSDRIRRIAVWALAVSSDPRQSRLLLGRDPGDDTTPRLVTIGKAEAGPECEPMSGLRLSPEALLLDGTAMACENYKVGLRSRSGWAALVDGSQVLWSRVAAEHPGPYPEGGANLTAYWSSGTSEIEHVGPLTDVAPGETAWLEQELRILTLSPEIAADPRLLAEALQRECAV